VRGLIAFAVLLAAMAFGVVAPATATQTAKLRVVALRPVTVKGLGFRADERVRVVLSAKVRHARTVRTTRTGTFVARFDVLLDLCAAFNLRATGSSGAVAVVARKPPPSCAALDPIR
jgi:hypothetical protein